MHLVQDWNRHRNECMPVSTQANSQLIRTPSPAPLEIIKVAGLLFFPSQGPSFCYLHSLLDGGSSKKVNSAERPQMVTVNCQICEGMQVKSCPTPLVQDYFTEGRPQVFVLTHGLSSEPLRFPLQIFYCPTSLSRGAPINKAIQRITAGAAAKPWAGPVLVLKFNGSRRQNYTDVSTNDLPTLSAHFLGHK